MMKIYNKLVCILISVLICSCPLYSSAELSGEILLPRTGLDCGSTLTVSLPASEIDESDSLLFLALYSKSDNSLECVKLAQLCNVLGDDFYQASLTVPYDDSEYYSRMYLWNNYCSCPYLCDWKVLSARLSFVA